MEKDDAEAAKWWRKAADGGDAESQHNLGTMSEQLPHAPAVRAASGPGVRKADVDGAKHCSCSTGSWCVLSTEYCEYVLPRCEGAIWSGACGCGGAGILKALALRRMTRRR